MTRPQDFVSDFAADERRLFLSSLEKAFSSFLSFLCGCGGKRLAKM
jgi:hypothetical protein